MGNKKLFCTGCNKEYSPDRIFPRCDDCFEPLEVKINYEKNTRKGKIVPDTLNKNILKRYSSFYRLPQVDNSISLKEGFTPLIKANTLSQFVDLDNLYFKNETVNPTWSFKDRGTFVCLQHAKSLGFNRIGTVSSGNMAASVAAYGARAKMKTFILVNNDIPIEKIHPILVYKPVLIKVKGNYGELYYESLKVSKETGIYFFNSDVPFRVEGSKSIAFEICEQFNYNVPEYIIIPTSSGGNARGIIKGFVEFYQHNLIKRLPRVICVQLQNCAPIYDAWTRKYDKISEVKNPSALDNAIANPYPPSGNELLRKLKMYNGLVSTVSDEEALKGQLLLAEEGIFAQPAACVSIYAIKKLREKGIIKKKDKCVAIVTGSGLKYTGILDKHRFDVETCNFKNLKEKILSNL